MPMAHLKRYTRQQVSHRTHRPCRHCRSVPTICPDCLRIWCLHCHPEQCPYPHPEALTTLINAPTKTKKSHKLRPRTTPSKKSEPIVIPESAQSWASTINELGYLITRIQPADRSLYVQGQWAVKLLCPPTSPTPRGDTFPTKPFKLIAFQMMPSPKGMIIDLILGK